MEVTTWAKRRQSDIRAVTQVKRSSLVRRIRGPTWSKTWKATVGIRNGDGYRRPRRGLRARHGWKGTYQGTWEIHHGPDEESGTPTERTIHREADAGVEVGPAGSTPSAGKPYTWGSGGAK
ncbi:MAG: hypothetical protein QXI12_11520 [Candidatus Methanomethyliaceae archaeon]